MTDPAVPARPIALVGLRCTGKSSVGAALAELLGRPFVDTDRELARMHGREGERAGGVLERVGLERFRELEAEVVAAVLARTDAPVVATGGGVVETPRLRALLRSAATCVWLTAPLDVLRERLDLDGEPRPSLTGADPRDELARLEERRAPAYRELAEHELDTRRGTPRELAQTLAHRLA